MTNWQRLLSFVGMNLVFQGELFHLQPAFIVLCHTGIWLAFHRSVAGRKHFRPGRALLLHVFFESSAPAWVSFSQPWTFIAAKEHTTVDSSPPQELDVATISDLAGVKSPVSRLCLSQFYKMVKIC